MYMELIFLISLFSLWLNFPSPPLPSLIRAKTGKSYFPLLLLRKVKEVFFNIFVQMSAGRSLSPM